MKHVLCKDVLCDVCLPIDDLVLYHLWLTPCYRFAEVGSACETITVFPPSASQLIVSGQLAACRYQFTVTDLHEDLLDRPLHSARIRNDKIRVQKNQGQTTKMKIRKILVPRPAKVAWERDYNNGQSFTAATSIRLVQPLRSLPPATRISPLGNRQHAQYVRSVGKSPTLFHAFFSWS